MQKGCRSFISIIFPGLNQKDPDKAELVSILYKYHISQAAKEDKIMKNLVSILYKYHISHMEQLIKKNYKEGVDPL